VRRLDDPLGVGVLDARLQRIFRDGRSSQY